MMNHNAAADQDAAARQRPDAPLGTLIFRAGLVPADQLEDALEEGIRRGRRLGEVLLERGLISEGDLARILAGQKGLEFVNPAELPLDPAAVAYLPEEKARLYRALPVRFEDGVPLVAVVDPTNEVVIKEVSEAMGVEPRFAVATRSDLVIAIGHAYAPGSNGAVVEQAQGDPDAGSELDLAGEGPGDPTEVAVAPQPFFAPQFTTPSFPADSPAESAADPADDPGDDVLPEPVVPELALEPPVFHEPVPFEPELPAPPMAAGEYEPLRVAAHEHAEDAETADRFDGVDPEPEPPLLRLAPSHEFPAPFELPELPAPEAFAPEAFAPETLAPAPDPAPAEPEAAHALSEPAPEPAAPEIEAAHALPEPAPEPAAPEIEAAHALPEPAPEPAVPEIEAAAYALPEPAPEPAAEPAATEVEAEHALPEPAAEPATAEVETAAYAPPEPAPEPAAEPAPEPAAEPGHEPADDVGRPGGRGCVRTARARSRAGRAGGAGGRAGPGARRPGGRPPLERRAPRARAHSRSGRGRGSGTRVHPGAREQGLERVALRGRALRPSRRDRVGRRRRARRLA